MLYVLLYVLLMCTIWPPWETMKCMWRSPVWWDNMRNISLDDKCLHPTRYHQYIIMYVSHWFQNYKGLDGQEVSLEREIPKIFLAFSCILWQKEKKSRLLSKLRKKAHCWEHTVEPDTHLCRITELLSALSLSYSAALSLGYSAGHTRCHVHKPAGHNRQISSRHILKFLSSWQDTKFPFLEPKYEFIIIDLNIR